VEAAKDQDPILEFERYLTAHAIVDDASLEQTRTEVKTEVDRQIDEAWNAADPEPDTLLRHVFFEGPEG
jgi:TPP-dependent pyruvate/acetoin dehydrogenase alpha subunit